MMRVKTRHVVATGAAVVVSAAIGLVPLAAAATGGPSARSGPVSIETVGPDQTGFTPAASATAAAPAQVIDGTTAHALVAAVTRARVSTQVAGTAPAADGKPARVTGLSFVIDFMDTGSKIGVAELYGLAVSGFGSLVPTENVPPPILDEAYKVLAVPPTVFAMFAQPTADGFNQLRAAIAPLAAGNKYANMLLQAMSDALIKVGTDGKALVNPFDAQVIQAGKFLLVLQEDG